MLTFPVGRADIEVWELGGVKNKSVNEEKAPDASLETFRMTYHAKRSQSRCIIWSNHWKLHIWWRYGFTRDSPLYSFCTSIRSNKLRLSSNLKHKIEHGCYLNTHSSKLDLRWRPQSIYRVYHEQKKREVYPPSLIPYIPWPRQLVSIGTWLWMTWGDMLCIPKGILQYMVFNIGQYGWWYFGSHSINSNNQKSWWPA